MELAGTLQDCKLGSGVWAEQQSSWPGALAGLLHPSARRRCAFAHLWDRLHAPWEL